ncbi:hypothetical protein AYO20_03397 [Fonsecaea nubica]|uniref:NACHT domain-containing protein n=1 Tax=Fonsecaea nubica TaxID=856822 RepID=A0A178D7N6_9EURO|nr:hypothetical protein AYO20_03397 [Fonsecaea nubica]OAL37221.1 hypothetical protein AYO20_03397 [Fonsecaea nubica]
MVLDPLSAIGLAANIVQFIDFSRRLISDAKEIYHSTNGTSAENVELQDVAESLSRLSSTLISPLDPSQAAVAQTEAEIVKIAAASRVVGDELQAAIQSLTAGDGSRKKWRSFLQALKTLWKRDKIAKLRKRLEDARSNLSVHVLSYISVRQGQALQSLEDARTQYLEIDSMRLQRLETMLESLRNLVQSTQDITGEHLTRIDQGLRSSEHEAESLRKETTILKSLVFERMAARYSAIAEAHKDTFKWIFEPSRWPSSDPRSGIRFHEWLTHGEGIYWVSGKPGSGKSTLMKYLYDCSETLQRLEAWADGSRLVTAGFFFWISGSDMQKSQLGLLRQVLFDILKTFPDWIPIICLERWARSRHGFQAEWTMLELNEAFRRLSHLTIRDENPSKLCIFVDGLDEYDGDPLDIMKTIQNIARIDNVKVCISSRPWNCFEDVFGQDPRNKLYLQDLTKTDIALYAREKLDEVANFSTMTTEVARMERLVSEIVSRAQGVFLWVYLVTRSLRDGLINGDSLSLLYERVLEMPSDLDKFFEKMIKSVDKVYRRRMAHTFRVVLATYRPLRLLLYSCIDEGDDILRQGSVRDDFMSVQVDEKIQVVEETMRRQLNGRYRGLLESTESSDKPGVKRVDFLHRTVGDFLETKQMQDLLASYSAQNFNAYLCICKAFIRQAENFPGSVSSLEWDDFFECASVAEDELGTPSTPLLDRMNDVCHLCSPTEKDSLELVDEIDFKDNRIYF